MRRIILGLVFTAASLALLFRLIDWDTTRRALADADPWLVSAAVVSLFLSIGAKCFRWRLLLPDESPVRTPALWRILHISYLFNNILPARLGDVARAGLTSRQPGLRLGHAVSSMLTERVTDTVTLLVAFVLVSPLLPLAAKYQGWLRTAWLALAALAVLVAAGIVLRRPLGYLTRKVMHGRVRPVPRLLRDEAVSFRDGWRRLFSRRHVLPIWTWSSAAWLFAFAINYLVMRAVGIHAPLAVAVLLTCTTNLAMLLPSSPGYVGIFHAAATLSLLPFGVSSSTAFSFAILAHLVNVVPVSIVGAACLLTSRDLNLALRPTPALVPVEVEPPA